MAKLSSISASPYIKALFYGDSGTWKTVTACSFPGPVHLLDFDNKASSAANFYAGTSQIDQISYENYGPVDKLGTAFERCNKALFDIKKTQKISDVFPAFPKTIIVDSLTTFADEVMRYLMRINPGIKRMDTKGYETPAMQDYQVARGFFKQFITELLNWPCNVIFTAHIQTDKDEITGEILRTPMLPGKLSAELPIYFPEVYRIGTKDGYAWAQTKSCNRFKCRTQIKGLANEVRMDLLYSEIAKLVMPAQVAHILQNGTKQP